LPFLGMNRGFSAQADPLARKAGL